MKNILCIIDTLGIGGAERQMAGLAVLLKKKGYTVDLVYYHKEDFYIPIVRKGGINPIYLSVENSQWSKFKAIRDYIKTHAKYDCVITYKGGPNAIGCLLKLYGMRFRLIVSERIANKNPSKYNKLVFWLYRFANYVVPNSYSQSEFLRSHYPWMKKKIVTITNFTDTSYFTPSKKQTNENIIILTAARIAKQKNIITYLDAITLLKERGIRNVHFEWYGDVQKGEEKYEELVKENIAKQKISDFISFHSNVYNIVEQYQRCSIFCLPSSFEGFPNVICEAMSCGKPIVCSRVCDNERIVSEEQNGLFFNPDDAKDIADKLETMIKKNKEQLEMWGRKSRELALELLSEERFINKYITLIEQ